MSSLCVSGAPEATEDEELLGGPAAAAVLDTRPGECDLAANSSTISLVVLTFFPPELMTDSICCSSTSAAGFFWLRVFRLLLLFALWLGLMLCPLCRLPISAGWRLLFWPVVSQLKLLLLPVLSTESLVVSSMESTEIPPPLINFCLLLGGGGGVLLLLTLLLPAYSELSAFRSLLLEACVRPTPAVSLYGLLGRDSGLVEVDEGRDDPGSFLLLFRTVWTWGGG